MFDQVIGYPREIHGSGECSILESGRCCGDPVSHQRKIGIPALSGGLLNRYGLQCPVF